MTKLHSYRSVITTSTGDVAQVLSITGPGAEADDVDTTTMDSSTNFRTFTAGLVDPGEVSLELLYDPALGSHKVIYHSLKERANKVWTIYTGTTTGDSDSFTGYVKALEREIQMEEMVKASVTIKVTGDPGYTT